MEHNIEYVMNINNDAVMLIPVSSIPNPVMKWDDPI